MSDILGGFKIPSLSGDPTNNPPAGYVFLYVVSSTYKMKLSNGSILTFATGISPEDVQDIIGSFIQNSSSINWVYDDVNNVMTAQIVQSAIDHTQISNKGTFTHNQIDSHINSTSNPHATTAAQVGADPVGTAATQVSNHVAALDPHPQYLTPSEANLLYDPFNEAATVMGAHLAASDPHPQYTTPAEAASAAPVQSVFGRVGAVIAAAGDYAANQISGLAAFILAQVLTGFTVGANAALAATDTILQAFGKIQGQINAINAILLTQILGDQFEEFLDSTAFTTSSGANQVAASFTTASKPAGKYRLAIEWDWTYNSTNNDAIYSVWVDGAQVSQEFRYELSDVTSQLLNNQWFYYPNFLTTQTHTIELRARCETAGSTVNVSQVRAEIWRVQ